ncbi:flavin reductase family protein [Gemella sp. zg-570]|uniref:flavin reductase family protein n=1 Tax=Gemella sp. zg-570 TaxID=2840371 RepID=UPI001C0DAA74|nr:flavin reductase family protein [Gemella sp. zg-570]QWQ38305.1 flavin reductase family protein [Gemella sp. zg-570]
MFIKEKSEIHTKKLYYAFPVVLVGYKDDKFKYNATTISSTYSLGNTINMGITSDSHAAEQIKKYGEFTINLPCDSLMSEIEICGFFSGNNKLQQADLPYTVGNFVDAPLIDECFLSMECRVRECIEFEGYVHFIGKIERRIADKNLVDEDGNFISEKAKTVHFIGCSNKRVYRYLKEETKDLGDFIEGGTSNCG